MNNVVNLPISQGKRYEFYKSLYKLYKNDHKIVTSLQIDQNLMEITSIAVQGTDEKAKQVVDEVRKRILKIRQNKSIYQQIAKESSDDFCSNEDMKRIMLIINLHFLREPFISKSESIEFKFLLVQLSNLYSKLITSLGNAIAESISISLEDTVKKIAIIEELRSQLLLYDETQSKNSIPKDAVIYEYQNGFKEIDFNSSDAEIDAYIKTDEIFVRYSVDLSGLTYITYENIDLNEHLKLEDLSKIQTIHIDHEIIDEVQKSPEDDKWKENIDLKKITITNHIEPVAAEPIEVIKESILRDENEIDSANEIFETFEKSLSPLLDANTSKEKEVSYRNMIINAIFTTFRNAYSKNQVTDHVIKNVTGCFVSALELVKTEEEHDNSPSYKPYLEYLRQIVENGLNP
jgi:hypothetical protein